MRQKLKGALQQVLTIMNGAVHSLYPALADISVTYNVPMHNSSLPSLL